MRIAFACVLLASSFAGCTVEDQAGSASDPLRGEVALALRDNYFEPRELWVAQGAEVVLTNRGTSAHAVGDVDEGLYTGILGSGGSYTFVMTKPGAFPLTCDFHPEMKATIHVVG